MDVSECDFYEKPYRRVPVNSATTQKEYIEQNSTVTTSTFNAWSGQLKRTLTTTYIDGATVLSQSDRSLSMKDLFPKGRNRQKPTPLLDKRMHPREAYMSLLPIDASSIRAIKNRSPLSMTTGKRYSSLPEDPHKNSNIQNSRLPGTIILEDNSQSKLYARCATTHANGGWVRRYKSINRSQTFNDLLRDQTVTDQVSLKKRPYNQLLALTSSASFNYSLSKRETFVIESNGTESQVPLNSDSSAVEDEESTRVDMTDRVIATSYRILVKLGAGSFGQVYLCEHIHTHERWAMKVESHNINTNPQLCIESKIYSILQGAPGFPRVDHYGTEGSFDILVMELLGPSLEDLFNYCDRKFTLKTALMLVDQMITRIEYVHTCHLIHRDIKPDNFLMGVKSMGHVVYIIDFGLSKRFRDPETYMHIPLKNNKSLTGTARYASVNAHKGTEQSRRDDLEAISYVFMYFVMGVLPWQGLQATARKAKFERIAEMKMKMTPEQICKNYPKECTLFVNYCRTLIFDHRPDYNYLRHLFRHLLYQQGGQYDYEYDWIIGHRNKQALTFSTTSIVDAASSTASEKY